MPPTDVHADHFWIQFLASTDYWLDAFGQAEFCRRISLHLAKSPEPIRLMSFEDAAAMEVRYQQSEAMQISNSKGPAKDAAYFSIEGTSTEQVEQAWERLRPFHLFLTHSLQSSAEIFDTTFTEDEPKTDGASSSTELKFSYASTALIEWLCVLPSADDDVTEKRFVPSDGLLGTVPTCRQRSDLYSPREDLVKWLSGVQDGDLQTLASMLYDDHLQRLLLHELCLMQALHSHSGLAVDPVDWKCRLSRIPLSCEDVGNGVYQVKKDHVKRWNEDLVARDTGETPTVMQAECVLGCISGVQGEGHLLVYDIRPKHRTVLVYTWSFADYNERGVLSSLLGPLLQRLHDQYLPDRALQYDPKEWRFSTSVPMETLPDPPVSVADSGPMAMRLLRLLALDRVDGPISWPLEPGLLQGGREEVEKYRLTQLYWLLNDKVAAEKLYENLLKGDVFPTGPGS